MSLAKCPFCASPAKVRQGAWNFYVECLSKDCWCAVGLCTIQGEVGGIFETEKEAEDAWNMRRPTS